MKNESFIAVIKKNGLTVRQLAALSGVSVRTIELYTSGRRDIGNAHARVVVALAEALQAHPREIIDSVEPSE